MSKKFLLITLLAVTTLQPSIESIRLKIGGIVNDYCSNGIAKKLAQLKGIKTIDVTKDGIATLELEKSNRFNLALLKPAIEAKTKYRIKTIRLTATGKIQQKNKYYALDLDTNPQKIYLTEVKYKNPQTEEENKKSNFLVRTSGNIYRKTMAFFQKIRNAAGEKFTKEVRMHCKHNAPVRFTGYVHRQADGTFWLSRSSARLKEVDDESDLILRELKLV